MNQAGIKRCSSYSYGALGENRGVIWSDSISGASFDGVDFMAKLRWLDENLALRCKNTVLKEARLILTYRGSSDVISG